MADASPNHKRPNKTQARLHESRAFAMRSKGATLQTIADELGLSREGVRKVLLRVDNRELKRIAEEYRTLKVSQDSRLETLIEESFGAWFKSKDPVERARRTEREGGVGGRGGGDESVSQIETVSREGNPAYIDKIRGLLSDQRSLWGLDVQAQPHAEYTTLSEVARKMDERAKAYEAEVAAEEARAAETSPADPPPEPPT